MSQGPKCGKKKGEEENPACIPFYSPGFLVGREGGARGEKEGKKKRRLNGK